MKKILILVIFSGLADFASADIMVGKTSSIQECLAVVKAQTGRQLKINTDTLEEVSGFVMLDDGGHDYFSCTLKATGTQGAYCETRFPAGLTQPKPVAEKAPANNAAGAAYPVPSDPKAKYYILDKSGADAERTITTKRVGSSGESFSKRLYNCTNKTWKYLGEGDSLEEMNTSKPQGEMGALTDQSISFYIGQAACK